MTQTRNFSETYYTLQMLTENHGWIFLKDGFGLTHNPLLATRYTSLKDALKAAHAIEDTDYHVEVVQVHYYSEWQQPAAFKRRVA